MKFHIELNDQQVSTLIKALDLYSRIGLGQFKEILDRQFNWNASSNYEDAIEKLEQVKYLLTEFESNEYRGIYGRDTPESCKIAWDIQQVVRHCQSWAKHPEGGLTVNFDEPLAGSQQPLPKCKVRRK